MRAKVRVGAFVAAVVAAGSVAVSLQSAGADAPDSTPLTKPRQFASGPPLRGDTVYVPIPPCRIVDTRQVTSPIDGATSRGVQVRGTTGFTAQGGTSSGCGVPAGASAVALSVTATGSAKNGFLIGYPGDTAKPSANFAWFWRDRTSTSNPTLALSRSGTADLRVYASATTQLIVDVAGYYEPQIEAYVTATGTSFYSATTRVLSVSSPSTGRYVIRVDTSVNNCVSLVTPTDPNRIARASTVADEIDVDLSNTSTAPFSAVDGDFNLSVTC